MSVEDQVIALTAQIRRPCRGCFRLFRFFRTRSPVPVLHGMASDGKATSRTRFDRLSWFAIPISVSFRVIKPEFFRLISRRVVSDQHSHSKGPHRMKTQDLNKICFAICIVCIIVGVLLGLTMVWTPGVNEVLWRLMATVGIVFLGASATLTVSRTYMGPRNNRSEDE